MAEVKWKLLFSTKLKYCAHAADSIVYTYYTAELGKNEQAS